MTGIKNILFKEFIVLPEDELRDFIAKVKYARYFEPKPAFGYEEKAMDFVKLSFDDVKKIQSSFKAPDDSGDGKYYFKEGIVWMNLLNFVSNEFNIDEKVLGNTDMFTWIRFKNWIEEGICKVATLEDHLRYEINDSDEAAGFGDLSEFGIWVQVKSLCQGDITKREEILNTPWIYCYVWQKMEKKEYDIHSAKMKQRR